MYREKILGMGVLVGRHKKIRTEKKKKNRITTYRESHKLQKSDQS